MMIYDGIWPWYSDDPEIIEYMEEHYIPYEEEQRMKYKSYAIDREGGIANDPDNKR